MKRLSAALSALEVPSIEKKETIRLRCFIQGAKIYKELFADYVDDRAHFEYLPLRALSDENLTETRRRECGGMNGSAVGSGQC